VALAFIRAQGVLKRRKLGDPEEQISVEIGAPGDRGADSHDCSNAVRATSFNDTVRAVQSFTKDQMNTSVWVLALLLLGLATGKLTGAGMAFTQGRTIYDLAAGLLGAVIAGVPLRLAGLSGYSASLPTLLVGVGTAMLATWLTRVVTWQAEPILRPTDDSSDVSNEQKTHDLMTTSDGTRLLLSAGRLVVPGAHELARRPS